MSLLIIHVFNFGQNLCDKIHIFQYTCVHSCTCTRTEYFWPNIIFSQFTAHVLFDICQDCCRAKNMFYVHLLYKNNRNMSFLYPRPTLPLDATHHSVHVSVFHSFFQTGSVVGVWIYFLLKN